jgi:hypothetical protein
MSAFLRTMSLKWLALAALFTIALTPSFYAQTVAQPSLMAPPTPAAPCHWTAAQQPWLTPAEQSCYATTPTYDETMTWLRRIASAAPKQVRIESFGRSGEGRELDLVLVSQDGTFDPAALHAAGRPILLVQNSIHAGEMDGKDASLALLRDLVITHTEPLGKTVFAFIPIYNADGHERRSAFNRINQDGPAEMGWRGNGTNLNLNRDYVKADAPETRAFLVMFRRLNPDFFVDDHVTDGADFQYDVTFSIDDGPHVAPATATWVDETVTPELVRYTDAHGHVTSPTYIDLVGHDLSEGIAVYDDPPRYSTGLVTLENRPAMLVELHMLKDYRTRVTGNTELLAGLLKLLDRDAAKLLALNAAADQAAAQRIGKPYPLTSEWSGETRPFAFKGYRFTSVPSEISGSNYIHYTHEPITFTIPQQVGYKVTASVLTPAAYLVPVQWTSVIERLKFFGVAVQHTTAPYTAEVDTYQCSGMTWQDHPFEGHHPTFPGEASGSRAGHYGTCNPVHETRTFPAGSVLVRMDQPLAGLAMNWLEPAAPDSALQWGFFDPIFEAKEYGEAYVVEKLAREMLAADLALKAEFKQKLATDPQFASSPDQRLAFFYDRSPYGRANRVGAYPVGRLQTLIGVPLAP